MSLLSHSTKDSSDVTTWKTILQTVVADATVKGTYATSKEKSQASQAAGIDSDDDESEQGESDGDHGEEDAEDEENETDARGGEEMDKEGEAGGGSKSVESAPMFRNKRVLLCHVGNYAAVRSVLEKQGATVMTHRLSCICMPILVNALTHLQDVSSVMHADASLLV